MSENIKTTEMVGDSPGKRSHVTYSNPETSRNIPDWPFGRELKTMAHFYIETDPKRGQRACRRTVDPRNGTLSAPKKLTFAKQARIVDGSDGKTYIIELTDFGFVSVMQGNMKFQQEAIFDTDPRHTPLVEMLKGECGPNGGSSK